MKSMRLYIIPLLSVLLLSGCLSDDYDDCEPVRLYLSYKGDGTTEILNRKIDKLDLYIYDSRNHNVLVRSVGQDELNRNEGVVLDLAPGEYNIVGIANDHGLTETSYTNADDHTKNFFSHPDYLSEKNIIGNDSLYLGHTEVVVPPKSKYSRIEETMLLKSSYIKMYIEVAGLKTHLTKSNDSYQNIIMRNLLPAMDFAGKSFGKAVSYFPLADYNSDDGLQFSVFNILRQSDYEHVIIDLLDKNEYILYSLKLIDFLNERPYIDMNKQEVLIAIRIELKDDGKIRVTIPDWYIKEIIPEF